MPFQKKCSCGRVFEAIPASARFSPGRWGGHYWECPATLPSGEVCNSTLFVPLKIVPKPWTFSTGASFIRFARRGEILNNGGAA